MRILIALLIVISIISIGCTAPECPSCTCPECPSCNCGAADCTCPECPECETDVKETIITKTVYVCQDGRSVDQAELCTQDEVVEIIFVPITTNENTTLIDEVFVKPGCVYGENGGTIYFSLGTIASSIKYQVKEDPADEFTTIHSLKNLKEGWKTFSIIDEDRVWTKGDFVLKQDKVYLFRMEFYLPGYDMTIYSNEYIIDLREGSDYMTKKC